MKGKIKCNLCKNHITFTKKDIRKTKFVKKEADGGWYWEKTREHRITCFICKLDMIIYFEEVPIKHKKNII